MHDHGATELCMIAQLGQQGAVKHGIADFLWCTWSIHVTSSC